MGDCSNIKRLRSDLTGMEKAYLPLTFGVTMEYDLLKLHTTIAEQGYAILDAGSSKPVSQVMQELALCFGGRVLAGRGRRVLETLRMLEANEAPLRSLSRFSGAGTQPWHVDGSHLTVPPRYVILGCDSVTASGSPPTQLMMVKDARSVLPASHRETFVVKNGGSSFYSTIASLDRLWIRFDPGCMNARSAQGCAMLEALDSLPTQPYLNLEWTVGRILIIDNWAVLHRRGNASGIGHRVLLRISLRD